MASETIVQGKKPSSFLAAWAARRATTKFQRQVFIWSSLTPILIYFLIFALIPILLAVYIGFFNWPLLGGERTFVGLTHYIEILQSPRFWNTVKNTTFFAVSYVFLVIVIGLGLALLLKSLNPVARLILRPIYFAPQVTTVVAVAIMFTWMFQPRTGVINYLLSFLGVPPLMWIASSDLALPTIILTAVWRSLGYTMVIFTAGLLQIPQDLYDAAQVDGSSGWSTFWNVTLPMLKPTTLFLFVTTTISGFQVFIEPSIMTQGGPGTATRVLMLEIFDQGFKYFEMGSAAAHAVYLFLLIAVIAYIQMRYMRQTFEF